MTTALDRPYSENLGPVSVAEFQLLVASMGLTVAGLGYLLVTAPPTAVARTLQTLAVAAGVTLLYRFCAYWFVVFVGGLASAYRSVRPGRLGGQVGR